LAEKNADEKYQRFVAHSAQAATTGAAVGGQTLSAASGPAIQTTQNLPPMGQFLRTLASSSEFRTTLSSVWSWLQHVLAGTLTAPTSAPNTSVIASALAGNAPNEGAADAQDAMWHNFSQFIRVLGGHPDYQRAIEGLFMFIEQMSDTVPQAAANAPLDAAKAQSRQMFHDAREIIEELAGGYSMATILDQARTIRSVISADQRIQLVLVEARQFVEGVLRQPAMLDNPAEIARGRSLMQQATCLTREYKDSIFMRQFFGNVTALLGAVRNDPSNKRLAAAYRDFGAAIITTNPQTGATEVNTQALSELRQLLIPLVMEQLRSVPISTIQGSNETYDFKLDGIILAANDIAPDRVRVKYDNDMEFDFRSLSLADTRRSDLTIHLEGMRTRLDNVRFWYQRKSFPKISDEGVANISLAGDGLDLKFRVRVAPTMPYFHVSKVDCDIDRMKIRILEAKHAALDKIVTSVFSGAIRKRVEVVIEERLAVTLQRVEEVMNRLAAQTGQVVQKGRGAAPDLVSKVAHAVMPGSSASTSSSAPLTGVTSFPTGTSS